MVRDPEVHRSVIREVLAYSREIGFSPKGLTFSPIKGPEGNIEYLVHLVQSGESSDAVPEETIDAVVDEAHKTLDKGNR